MESNLAGFAFFLILALIISWIAFAKGYYHLPYKEYKGAAITLQDVFASFFIFLASYFFLLPLIHYPILSHIITFVVASLLFFLYGFWGNRTNMIKVWKDRSFPESKSILKDLETGLVFWFLAIPVVTSVTYLAELLTSLIASPTNKEQVAVRFLKESLGNPLTSSVAFFSIIIAAPIFEEFLFRGVLLSYLRTKMGTYVAIFTSALIFSLFHFSPSQSIENISLLLTLFAFGSYLGFVYLKTRSLYSSILLHVTFNSISVIRIIFTHV